MSNKEIMKRKRLLESRMCKVSNANSRVTIAKMINNDFNNGNFKVYRRCGCLEGVRSWVHTNVVSKKYESVPAKHLKKCYPHFPREASGNVVGVCFGTHTSGLLPSGGTITKANDYDNFIQSLGTGSRRDTCGRIQQRYNYKCLDNGKNTYQLWRDLESDPLLFYGHRISFLYEHVTCDKSGRASTCYIWQCATDPLLVSLRKTIPLLYNMKEDTYFGLLPREVIDLVANYLLDLYETD